MWLFLKCRRVYNCLTFHLLGFLCTNYWYFPKLNVKLKHIQSLTSVLLFSLEGLFLGSHCAAAFGQMLSHYAARFLFSLPTSGELTWLCLPTSFLNPLPRVGWCAREKFWNLVSWKRLQVRFPLSFGRHCSVASGVTVERLIWAPAFHAWPVQSLETFTVFLSLVFQNFIMIWLCGLVSFFFPINCAWHLETLILWNFFNYFFENYLSPAFILSISGPLVHYLDLLFVVYFSPVLCLRLFILLCFCLFSACK